MLYREMERDDANNSDNLEDMRFNGGLCIPGKIWHRLYKYVTSNALSLAIYVTGFVKGVLYTHPIFQLKGYATQFVLDLQL